MPSTAVMPREGSFALAFPGKVRKVQETAVAVTIGRKSFALNRILIAVLVIFEWCRRREFAFLHAAHSLNGVRFEAPAVSAPNVGGKRPAVGRLA